MRLFQILNVVIILGFERHLARDVLDFTGSRIPNMSGVWP